MPFGKSLLPGESLATITRTAMLSPIMTIPRAVTNKYIPITFLTESLLMICRYLNLTI